MSDAVHSDTIKISSKQLGRYSVVGLINTSIDFITTNLLVWLTGAVGAGTLFVISLFACLLATCNSYWMNRLWTFGTVRLDLPKYALVKYFCVALLAMLVNTSVFLFVFQYAHHQFTFSRFAALNIAKLFGVGTACVIAFLGFRISVFRPASITRFREAFRFHPVSLGYNPSTQVWILLLLGLSIRLIYLTFTTSIVGDAVNYGWVTRALAEGNWAEADKGWYNPFCYWQAGFHLLGCGHISAAIGSSLIPGVLLIAPTVLLARALYGEKVAWFTGALSACHPRLVEYSCNGYSESFYLFALVSAVTLWTISLQRPVKPLILILTGGLLAVFFTVRNEALVFLGLCLIGTLIIAKLKNSEDSQETKSLWLKHPWKSATTLLFGFSLVTLCYCGVSLLTVGHHGVFKRVSVLAKKYSEQLSPREAAREVYGFQRAQSEGEWNESLKIAQIWRVLERFPKNALHTLKTLPGVLLSPLCFFAFLLPIFVRIGPRNLWAEWPLIAQLIFPFLIYPVLHLEPRYLLAALIPIHIFGCAGAVAFCRFLGTQGLRHYIYPALVTTVLGLSLSIVVWRAQQVEQRYAVNREVAQWISHHVDPSENLVGCGYGFVSTTGFLAGRRTINRVWHYNPKKIVSFVRNKDSRWLVIYETFLRKVNPELLPVLKRGLPGMELVYETLDRHTRKVQIYRMKEPKQAQKSIL